MSIERWAVNMVIDALDPDLMIATARRLMEEAGEPHDDPVTMNVKDALFILMEYDNVVPLDCGFEVIRRDVMLVSSRDDD